MRGCSALRSSGRNARTTRAEPVTLMSRSHRHSSSVNASTAPKSCTPTLEITRSACAKPLAQRCGGGLDARCVAHVDAQTHRLHPVQLADPRGFDRRPLSVEVEEVKVEPERAQRSDSASPRPDAAASDHGDRHHASSGTAKSVCKRVSFDDLIRHSPCAFT